MRRDTELYAPKIQSCKAELLQRRATTQHQLHVRLLQPAAAAAGCLTLLAMPSTPPS
jgi:hypothetical protein